MVQKNIKKSTKTVRQNFVSEGIILSVFTKELQGGVCRHKFPGMMKLTVTNCILQTRLKCISYASKYGTYIIRFGFGWV